jgi:Ca2+-binding RTX toxin-like protein
VAALTGGDGANVLDASAFAGRAVLTGGGGDDVLRGARGGSLLRGGTGNDTLDANGASAMASGGPGSDALVAAADADFALRSLPFGRAELTVTVAGAVPSVQRLSGVERAALTGGAGNNVIDASRFRGAVTLAGGTGNDSLTGGSGHDVLLGEGGDDVLIGGAGRNILIGGFGGDNLTSNAGEDLLVAGTTAFDADPAALGALLAEWASATSYAARVANIQTGGGLANGARLVGDDSAGQTAFADADVDSLTGGLGQDWFLANQLADNGGAIDLVTDQAADETYTDTDL